ncbi:hypothetical protein AX16_007516 [Volvariella volvacea WC 439]|nr:hypothetical protein AX16_007516 [Volvariella volvacea WC 439]
MKEAHNLLPLSPLLQSLAISTLTTSASSNSIVSLGSPIRAPELDSQITHIPQVNGASAGFNSPSTPLSSEEAWAISPQLESIGRLEGDSPLHIPVGRLTGVVYGSPTTQAVQVDAETEALLQSHQTQIPWSQTSPPLHHHLRHHEGQGRTSRQRARSQVAYVQSHVDGVVSKLVRKSLVSPIAALGGVPKREGYGSPLVGSVGSPLAYLSSPEIPEQDICSPQRDKSLPPTPRIGPIQPDDLDSLSPIMSLPSPIIQSGLPINASEQEAVGPQNLYQGVIINQIASPRQNALLLLPAPDVSTHDHMPSDEPGGGPSLGRCSSEGTEMPPSSDMPPALTPEPQLNRATPPFLGLALNIPTAEPDRSPTTSVNGGHAETDPLIQSDQRTPPNGDRDQDIVTDERDRLLYGGAHSSSVRKSASRIGTANQAESGSLSGPAKFWFTFPGRGRNTSLKSSEALEAIDTRHEGYVYHLVGTNPRKGGSLLIESPPEPSGCMSNPLIDGSLFQPLMKVDIHNHQQHSLRSHHRSNVTETANEQHDTSSPFGDECAIRSRKPRSTSTFDEMRGRKSASSPSVERTALAPVVSQLSGEYPPNGVLRQG